MYTLDKLMGVFYALRVSICGPQNVVCLAPWYNLCAFFIFTPPPHSFWHLSSYYFNFKVCFAMWIFVWFVHLSLWVLLTWLYLSLCLCVLLFVYSVCLYELRFTKLFNDSFWEFFIGEVPIEGKNTEMVLKLVNLTKA
jgi:hypothetical protein